MKWTKTFVIRPINTSCQACARSYWDRWLLLPPIHVFTHYAGKLHLYAYFVCYRAVKLRRVVSAVRCKRWITSGSRACHWMCSACWRLLIHNWSSPVCRRMCSHRTTSPSKPALHSSRLLVTTVSVVVTVTAALKQTQQRFVYSAAENSVPDHPVCKVCMCTGGPIVEAKFGRPRHRCEREKFNW